MRSGGVSEAAAGRIGGVLADRRWACRVPRMGGRLPAISGRAIVPAPSDVICANSVSASSTLRELWAPLAADHSFCWRSPISSPQRWRSQSGSAMGRSHALFNLLEPPLSRSSGLLPKPALPAAAHSLHGPWWRHEDHDRRARRVFPVLINTVQVHAASTRSRSVRRGPSARAASRSCGRSRCQPPFHSSSPGWRVGSRPWPPSWWWSRRCSREREALVYLILDMQRTFQARARYAWLRHPCLSRLRSNAGFVLLERRILFWSAGFDQ